MKLSCKGLGKPISLLFLAMIIGSCTTAGTNPSQDVYYTTPPVTFIRESPKYDSPNVAAVYRGDQVVVMSRKADDWCQVQAVQSGKIGWIQTPLLSPQPISTPTYSVQLSTVPLLDSPQKNATSPVVLHKGDKVRKLSENQEGWWMVLTQKDKNLGWLQATAVSGREPETAAPSPPAGASGQGPGGTAAAPPPPAPKQFFYVATANLNLHSLPLVSSQVVNTLKFNDKVEKIDQSDSQWIKVKYPASGAKGWAQGIFLADSSLKTPKVFPQKRRTSPRRPVCPKPTEPEKAAPEEVEPVVM